LKAEIHSASEIPLQCVMKVCNDFANIQYAIIRKKK